MCVSASLAVARLLPVLKPLFEIIPVKWQWVPSTIAAAAGAISLMNPADTMQSIEVLLGVLVLIVLSAQQGFKK